MQETRLKSRMQVWCSARPFQASGEKMKRLTLLISGSPAAGEIAALFTDEWPHIRPTY